MADTRGDAGLQPTTKGECMILDPIYFGMVFICTIVGIYMWKGGQL